MEQYYTDEKNVQILVALLKKHGIKRIVASPGSTNVTFVGSVQQDPFFEIYSCVDERSAAYMACGMAAETDEPVVLSCTGATASRNYFPALTEAFYRKLPVLAVTSTQDRSRIGHLITQAIDRSVQPNDTVKVSVYLQNIKDERDEWECMIKANKAILELWHHGGGPAHIDLATSYSPSFKTRNLPEVNLINRYTIEDDLPDLPMGRIAVFVGSHCRWDERACAAIDSFCSRHNAVVFCDPTANYIGKFGVNYILSSHQEIEDSLRRPDLLIHIGNMSDFCDVVAPLNVWRVSEDGELCDRYNKLRNVFEMKEESFFKHYAGLPCAGTEYYLDDCRKRAEKVYSNIPDLPFSHLWVAQYLQRRIPKNSVVHYGILSPLRSWGYFEKQESVSTFCNQGGFGIDGNMSTLIGASLMKPDKLFYGIVGDLSFFYDINSLCNRHVGKNLRIILINNAKGAEFHLFRQLNSIYVNNVEKYISAGGHNGKQSITLVRDFVTALGFEYISASNKCEFDSVAERFVSPEIKDKSIVFEIFTDVADENLALFQIREIEKDPYNEFRQKVKSAIKEKEFISPKEKKYRISLENIHK